MMIDWTPLHYATGKDLISIVEYLISHGSDIDPKNSAVFM